MPSDGPILSIESYWVYCHFKVYADCLAFSISLPVPERGSFGVVSLGLAAFQR